MTSAPPVTRIAVADDDAECLDLIRDILKSPRNELWETSSGGGLVELVVERGPFDLIITDIDMPWMDGLSVIRSVRAAEITTPVVVITGLHRADLESTVARLGNTKLLRKPIAVYALRSAVAQLIGALR